MPICNKDIFPQELTQKEILTNDGIKLQKDYGNLIKHSHEDFDILKKYWSDWLKHQKVKKDNYKIIRTDLNAINRDFISNFFAKVIRDNNW